LLEGTSDKLRALMHRLNGLHANRYNTRHEHTGHVFGERYSVYLVRDEAHPEKTLGYIRDNPVKAGLCAPGEDWPWTWIAGLQPLGQTPAGSVP
jgi:putative transposase